MPASAGMTRGGVLVVLGWCWKTGVRFAAGYWVGGGVYVGVRSQFMRMVRIVVVRMIVAVAAMRKRGLIIDDLLSIYSTGSIR